MYGAFEDTIGKVLKGDPGKFQMPPNSPFIVEIVPDIVYQKQSLGLTLIKIRTRTEPSTEIIDIALMRPDYKFYQVEWEMIQGNLVGIGGIRVANAVFSYFDQQMAAALNTRPEKRAVRAQRVENLRKRMPVLLPNYRNRVERMTAIFEKYTPVSPGSKKDGGRRSLKRRSITYKVRRMGARN
jgi:hypothetical protein